MRTMYDLPDVAGKRVMVRVDFNVPITDGVARAEDAGRVFAHLRTIQDLAARGARVVVVSHLGRGGDSLEPVADLIRLVMPIELATDVVGPDAKAKAMALQDGQVLLLENVRREVGEEQNSPAFASQLAALADLFVLDAFSAAHRAHASIVGVPELIPAYAGFVFMDEYEGLSPLLSPTQPFILALGGAKFETKLPLINAYKDKATQIILGGALLNSVLAARGSDVGQSLVDTSIDISTVANLSTLFVPDRVIVMRGAERVETAVSAIQSMDVIADIAPIAFAPLSLSIRGAKTILWNGPVGIVEKDYTSGTRSLIEMFSLAHGATRVSGGGDTAAFLSREGLAGTFSFVSLSGGAMLDFLADGSLPGIDALEESEIRF